MITSDRFERRLPELLAELAGSDDAGFLRDVLEATSTTRQRRPWRQSGLWNPAGLLGRGTEVGHSPALRMFVAAGLVLLLVLAAFAAGSAPNRAVPPSPSPSSSASAIAAPIASGPLRRTQPLAFGPRGGASAVVLTDGRVLVLGGTEPRAEIYDPATGQFVATGTMTSPRLRPQLALLRDGRVLVVGGMHLGASGSSDGIALATAEIFDPAAGTFASTGSTRFGRWTCCYPGQAGEVGNPSALLLRDGRVLVVGGRQQDPASGDRRDALPAQAEIYDPTATTFRQLDVGCESARGGQVRLRDGRVLVTCLVGTGEQTNRARLFNPLTDTFSETGHPTTSGGSTATLTRDGRVLLIGVGSAEIYDPATEAFHDLGIVRVPGLDQPPVTLSEGGILFVGSGGERWFYFLATEDELHGYSSFSDSPPEPAAVLLRDGDVLVVGDAPFGVLYR